MLRVSFSVYVVSSIVDIWGKCGFTFSIPEDDHKSKVRGVGGSWSRGQSRWSRALIVVTLMTLWMYSIIQRKAKSIIMLITGAGVDQYTPDAFREGKTSLSRV